MSRSTKSKIRPKGGIKVLVLDQAGTTRVLGTIPVWENPTPAQEWVINNSGVEFQVQAVYVASEESFSLEGEVSLQKAKKSLINSKFKVTIKEV